MEAKPVPSLEEKIAALEAKIASLEKRHNEFHERAFIVTENSPGKPNEVAKLTILTNGEENNEVPKEISDSTPAPVSRARVLLNKPDPDTGERKDQLPTDTTPVITRDTSHAFTLRKNFYQHEGNDGEIEINDLNLWKLLKDLLRHYPYHTFQGDPVSLYSPYEPLILNWEKLESAAMTPPNEGEDGQARSDLKLLLDTILSGSGDLKLDKFFRTRASNREQKTVTFETLWTIFPPGTVVYGKPFQREDQIFIVRDNRATWPDVSRRSPLWGLDAWTYDWNGKVFKRKCLRLDFEQFEGHKPITSLPYYPFELHENREAIEIQLKNRGVKYRDFCIAKRGQRMFKYSGEAIFGKKGFSGVQGDDDQEAEDGLSRSGIDVRNGPGGKSISIDSTVMVDFESYFRYGPAVARVGELVPDEENVECDCQDCRDNNLLATSYRINYDKATGQEDKWEDEQYMLCPPRVLGYILRDKQWAQLQVSYIHDIPMEDNINAWTSKLQLAGEKGGADTKKLLMSLVKNHGSAEPASGKDHYQMNDIVVNKGKGLVILLYGPPGVGKTSTAETVAIAARKPLFSVSVADVGTKAKNVEANLAKIFDLATTWEAVLLIDEADVFLESRGKGPGSNTERNALVSVFLRVLEYYKGILILTTNQIAQFDVAVQSRIHIAIKYSNLDKVQTLAIFRQFLEQLQGQSLVKDLSGILEWLEEDVWSIGFDGRQIRNIMSSALGLARADGRNQLDKRDIKMVAGIVKDFKNDFRSQYEKYINDQKGLIS